MKAWYRIAKHGSVVLIGALPLWSASGFAAPGTPANVPLFLGRGMNPNIMLLVDNSLSMKAFVPGENYDKSIEYGPCPTSRQVNSSHKITLQVKAGGNAYFQISNGGTNYGNFDWGTGSGPGANGYETRCFNPHATYEADLESADLETYSRGYALAYSGNFLNWYFSDEVHTEGANFGAGRTERPGMRTRMDVAKGAAAQLVQEFEDVNLGLSTYSNTKAQILFNISDMDVGANRSNLINKVNELDYLYSTPLASALGAVGRYFVEGKTSQMLASGQTVGSLLSEVPSYATGVAQPTSTSTVIQDFCQQNFVLALTDGEPMQDNHIADAIETYAEDSDGQPLNDVTKALFDIDWRPDLKDSQGRQVKNNIVSHMIGFGDESIQNSSLLRTAALNGGGEFKTAENGSDLVQAFEELGRSIQAQTGSVAAVAFNGTILNSDSAVFASAFNTGTWTSTLAAYPLDAETGQAGEPAWEAAAILDEMDPEMRTILTHDGDKGVAFRWPSLSTIQKSDLMGALSDETEGAARLAYLRGSRDNEQGQVNGGIYRARGSLLGDIINSGTLYVGSAENEWPDVAPFGADDKRYRDFQHATAERMPMVYVGANDGMLHGFQATLGGTGSGQEKLAYVPSQLSSADSSAGLRTLTDPAYEHRYYVDLTPVASDMYFAGAWHTVLVGGLRAGGKGYFAVDVTDPDDFSEAKAADLVLWEYPESDQAVDADLGLSFSRPAIAMMNNDTWAVIFGNGYESASGEALLYILLIDDTTGKIGEVKKLRTGDGSEITKNGLGSPAVIDLDGDQQADRIYAADVQGNLWAFDVSAENSDSWDVAHQDGEEQKTPLFHASDENGKPQPITIEPVVARHPSEGSDPNLFVMIGTGQFITNNDVSSSSVDVQSIYGIRDQGTAQLTREDLVERNLSARDATSRKIAGGAVAWSGDAAVQGWYLDLSLSLGERVVNALRVRGDTLFVNSIVPELDSAEQNCSAAGESWLYGLRWLTGLTDAEPVMDANNDGSLDSGDASAAGARTDGILGDSGFLGNRRYTPMTDPPGDTMRDNACGGSLTCDKIENLAGGTAGRTAWTEIFEE